MNCELCQKKQQQYSKPECTEYQNLQDTRMNKIVTVEILDCNLEYLVKNQIVEYKLWREQEKRVENVVFRTEPEKGEQSLRYNEKSERPDWFSTAWTCEE